MDRADVIKGLRCCIKLDGDGYPNCERCPYGIEMVRSTYACTDVRELMRDALTLLEAQEQEITSLKHHVTDARELLDALKPRLMTEEEANELAWDYCYLEEESFSGGHKIKCITWPSIASAKLKYGAGAYGKRWRCWTQRPTDEQRKAVKWDG